MKVDNFVKVVFVGGVDKELFNFDCLVDFGFLIIIIFGWKRDVISFDL